MKPPINDGAALPTSPEERWYKVVSPHRSTPLVAGILGDTFFGQWTHWVQTTIPCSADHHCRYCREGMPNRWVGYIAATIGGSVGDRVLALTEGAARQLLPILTKRGTLRGLEIELKREAGKPNGAVMVKVLNSRSPDSVKPSFCVLSSLSRMWGVNEAYLNRGLKRLKDRRVELLGTDGRAIGEARETYDPNDVPFGDDHA